jgi:hypothetical protein
MRRTIRIGVAMLAPLALAGCLGREPGAPMSYVSLPAAESLRDAPQAGTLLFRDAGTGRGGVDPAAALRRSERATLAWRRSPPALASIAGQLPEVFRPVPPQAGTLAAGSPAMH